MQGLIALLAIIVYFFVISSSQKRADAAKPKLTPTPRPTPPPVTPPPPKPAAEAVKKTPEKSAPTSTNVAKPAPAPKPAAPKPAAAAKPAAAKPEPKPAAAKPEPKPAAAKPEPKPAAAKPEPKPAAAKSTAPPAATAITAPGCAPYMLPALPDKFQKTYTSKSRTKADVNYEINPAAMTCTCDAAKKAQSAFKNGDARRLCAHQVAKLKQIRAKPHYDDLSWALITLAKEAFDPCYAKVSALGTDILIGFDPKSDDVSVYAKPKKAGESAGGLSSPYARFGFNVRSGAWSKSTGSPTGSATEIKKEIAKLFGA